MSMYFYIIHMHHVEDGNPIYHMMQIRKFGKIEHVFQYLPRLFFKTDTRANIWSLPAVHSMFFEAANS